LGDESRGLPAAGQGDQLGAASVLVQQLANLEAHGLAVAPDGDAVVDIVLGVLSTAVAPPTLASVSRIQREYRRSCIPAAIEGWLTSGAGVEPKPGEVLSGYLGREGGTADAEHRFQGLLHRAD
jgi:uncharacterized caspase-like protein